jgi:DNA-binding protein HU-beta/integration host factor subunit alpha
MNWAELQSRIAERTGLPKDQVRVVLDAASDETLQAIARGEAVRLGKLVTLESVIRSPKVIRSVSDARKVLVGERATVKVRPSAALQRAAASRVNESWRDPAHQEAWRLAEALVGDFELYRWADLPKVDAEGAEELLRARCREALGEAWRQAEERFDASVPEEVRSQRNYLLDAVRRRWS